MIGVLLAGATLAAEPTGEWAPPDPPDPRQILNEARDDRDAGRYALALQKHVWYHENALKYQQSQYGVRLSFALYAWRRLASLYPPALEKMELIRDQAADRVRSGPDERNAFHDFEALNRTLQAEDRTVSLFKWLDANDPSLAESVFSMAKVDRREEAEEIANRAVKHVESDRHIQQIRDARDGLVPERIY